METIRYYQRRGLLTEPVRPAGGQRRYSPNDARRVRFIKRAQVLGFTLEEVGSPLTGRGSACAETKHWPRKLRVIDQKLADLRRCAAHWRAAAQNAKGLIDRGLPHHPGKCWTPTEYGVKTGWRTLTTNEPPRAIWKRIARPDDGQRGARK